MEAQVNNPSTSRRLNFTQKKVLIISFFIALVLVLVGVTLYSLGVFPGVGTQVKNEDPLIASVGDKNIYLSEIEKAADDQYLKSAITTEVLKNYLNILIERAILDHEASQKNITLSDEQINERVKQLFPNKEANQNLLTHAKYDLLKEKILPAQLKSTQAYTIGFWIPPTENDNTNIKYKQQRTVTKQALDFIESELKNGEEYVVVSEMTNAKFPILASILGINGYNFAATDDKEFFNTPKLFTFGKEELEDLNDPLFYETLLTMEEGEIKQVFQEDGSGGSVIKVIKVTREGYQSYSQFIEIKRKELLIIHKNL